MKNDLIERYLYAVTRRMNPKIRDDVKKELSGLIDDMLMERCGERIPEEKDVRIVLTELGTPQELYLKYSEDADKCLIPQPYYGAYTYVMKIVLLAMAIGMTVVAALTALEEAQIWIEVIVSWFSLMWSGMLHAVAIVTIVFVFLSRKGVTLGEPFNLDNLPVVPEKKQEISRGDCIFGIGCCVVLIALVLGAPEYLVGYWGPDGVIPLFNGEVLRNCWYLVLIFGSMDITRSAIRLVEGSYNRRVMVSTLVTNGIGAVAVVLWLTTPGLINPEFVSHVQKVFVDEESFIRNLFLNFQSFLLTVILIAYVADAAKAIIKYVKK